MKKDFLAISDFTREEIISLLDRTAFLKEKRKKGELFHPLVGKTLGMIFNKPSTRTRISFEVAMYELGGHPLFLPGDQLQLKRGETLKDSAQVLSRYLDALMIRTFDHNDVLELAEHSSIPVINGLTDLNHPVQVLSDVFTLREKLGQIEDIKVAYVGDANNVTYSWIMAAPILGINLTVASPKEYPLEIPKDLGKNARHKFVEDPNEAVKDVDVIYTDVWVSMGQENLADDKLKRLQKYQVNQSLVGAAKKDVLVMHCLPAHREMEITTEVFDGKHSIVFDQAENRLHFQKALLETLLTRDKP